MNRKLIASNTTLPSRISPIGIIEGRTFSNVPSNSRDAIGTKAFCPVHIPNIGIALLYNQGGGSFHLLLLDERNPTRLLGHATLEKPNTDIHFIRQLHIATYPDGTSIQWQALDHSGGVSLLKATVSNQSPLAITIERTPLLSSVISNFPTSYRHLQSPVIRAFHQIGEIGYALVMLSKGPPYSRREHVYYLAATKLGETQPSLVKENQITGEDSFDRYQYSEILFSRDHKLYTFRYSPSNGLSVPVCFDPETLDFSRDNWKLKEKSFQGGIPIAMTPLPLPDEHLALLIQGEYAMNDRHHKVYTMRLYDLNTLTPIGDPVDISNIGVPFFTMPMFITPISKGALIMGKDSFYRFDVLASQQIALTDLACYQRFNQSDDLPLGSGIISSVSIGREERIIFIGKAFREKPTEPLSEKLPIEVFRLT